MGTRPERPMPTAHLSLGSNLDPERHLRAAIAALRARFGQVRVSRVYRFPAVGYHGPDFLNAAASLETDLSPDALNAWLHALEDAHGRDRSGPRYSDRTLDIDIVLYDDLVAEGAGHLRLPRDELRHAFVLKPLAEIAPDAVHPTARRTVAELWRAHADHDRAFEAVALEPVTQAG
jgi:2-amino-4-hydroxy-6-hydroxymethyldihydropteridine diphosphokinase